MSMSIRKVIVLSLIGTIFLVANLTAVANWLSNQGAIDWANFYDFFRTDAKHIMFIVADVSGNELANHDPKPGRVFTGEARKDYFGRDIACGDVNNDGFDDLAIGAYGYKAGTNQGRVYLYYGGPRDK